MNLSLGHLLLLVLQQPNHRDTTKCKKRLVFAAGRQLAADMYVNTASGIIRNTSQDNKVKMDLSKYFSRTIEYLSSIWMKPWLRAGLTSRWVPGDSVCGCQYLQLSVEVLQFSYK